MDRIHSSEFLCLIKEPTPDLEPETLSVLTALCLAQAQEMVVQKALKELNLRYLTLMMFLLLTDDYLVSFKCIITSPMQIFL